MRLATIFAVAGTRNRGGGQWPFQIRRSTGTATGQRRSRPGVQGRGSRMRRQSTATSRCNACP
eukprot:365209-Chlamydomonas_euryale.AAC.9